MTISIINSISSFARRHSKNSIVNLEENKTKEVVEEFFSDYFEEFPHSKSDLRMMKKEKRQKRKQNSF